MAALLRQATSTSQQLPLAAAETSLAAAVPMHHQAAPDRSKECEDVCPDTQMTVRVVSKLYSSAKSVYPAHAIMSTCVPEKTSMLQIPSNTRANEDAVDQHRRVQRNDCCCCYCRGSTVDQVISSFAPVAHMPSCIMPTSTMAGDST